MANPYLGLVQALTASASPADREELLKVLARARSAQEPSGYTTSLPAWTAEPFDQVTPDPRQGKIRVDYPDGRVAYESPAEHVGGDVIGGVPPARQWGDLGPGERAFILPATGNAQGGMDVGIQHGIGAFHHPREAVERLMSPEGQYRPGSGHGQGVQDAMDAATFAFPGMVGARAAGLAREGAEASARRAGPMEPADLASEKAPAGSGGSSRGGPSSAILADNERASALAAAPWADEGITLSVNRADAKRGHFRYAIIRDGKNIGTIEGSVSDGGKGNVAHVENMASRFGFVGGKGDNPIGVAGVRALREAFRSDFPNVTEFKGERADGAKPGRTQLTRNQSVRILADNERGGVPIAAANEIGRQQKPTAGTTPLSERQAKLEAGREDLFAPRDPIDARLDSLTYGMDRMQRRLDGHSPREVDQAQKEQYHRGLSAFDDAERPFRLNADSSRPEQAAINELSRQRDSLGFYSRALEAAKALKQEKGTPEQMRAQLRNAGVKEAELQATDLDKFLTGKSSVTRDEIVKHLEDNRVQVRAMEYGGDTAAKEELKRVIGDTRVDDVRRAWGMQGEMDALTGYLKDYLATGRVHPSRTQQVQQIVNRLGGEERARELLAAAEKPATKWSSYSLDPSNPTYRETVIHLPKGPPLSFEAWMEGQYPGQLQMFRNAPDVLAQFRKSYEGQAQRLSSPDYFITGHWSEPNVIAHARTSLVKDSKGKTVFNIDELQSDWGQKLREGGVRDEAKIKELEKRRDDAIETQDRVADRGGVGLGIGPHDPKVNPRISYNGYMQEALAKYAETGKPLGPGFKVTLSRDEAGQMAADLKRAMDTYSLSVAELQTAKAATPGHPLVNTTDQWTTTALRRMVMQAVDSGADKIAIPSGDTVLSYGMGGKPEGQRAFYNEIAPKNLRKILEKIDPSIKPEFENTMYRDGGKAIERSKGFTVFPITDKVRKAAKEDGFALFANKGEGEAATAAGAELGRQTNRIPNPIRGEDRSKRKSLADFLSGRVSH